MSVKTIIHPLRASRESTKKKHPVNLSYKKTPERTAPRSPLVLPVGAKFRNKIHHGPSHPDEQKAGREKHRAHRLSSESFFLPFCLLVSRVDGTTYGSNSSSGGSAACY